MYGTNRLRTMCVVVALAGAAILGLGGTAQAASSTVPNAGRLALPAAPDPVAIDTLRIDLAGLFFPPATVGGSWIPAGNAVLTWQTNGAPRLFGWVGMENAANFCGHVRLRYFTSAGEVATRSFSQVCPAGNGFAQALVNYSGYTNSAVTSVEVILELQYNGGLWEEEASVTLRK